MRNNKKKKRNYFNCIFFLVPVCNPDGSPRGQQQGLVRQTRKDGAEGWVLSGWSCVLTQAPHWKPQTHPPQTKKREKQKINEKEFSDVHIFVPNVSSKIIFYDNNSNNKIITKKNNREVKLVWPQLFFFKLKTNHSL